ncbi:MAG: OmpH family outer membrane protein [Bacteroidales bacterium]|nr:OmpH family outer membrane protein [Bacteroidales bacterium]
MKRFIIIIFTALLVFSFQESSAQSKIKLGHVDFGKLYSMMPGLDSVRTIFNAYKKTIQDQFAAMQVEYENKINDYQANVEGMSNIIRQTKEAELQDLAARLDAFETQATEDLQRKEIELTSPIIEQARTAVENVAKENGYNYVFNSTEGLLLYAEPADDLLPLVKKKLNITVPTPQDQVPALDIEK